MNNSVKWNPACHGRVEFANYLGVELAVEKKDNARMPQYQDESCRRLTVGEL